MRCHLCNWENNIWNDVYIICTDCGVQIWISENYYTTWTEDYDWYVTKVIYKKINYLIEIVNNFNSSENIWEEV